VTVTWDPAAKGAALTLSGGNLTATANSSSDSLVRATLGYYAGSSFQSATRAPNKLYLEVDVTASGFCCIGINNTAEPTADFVGQTDSGCGIQANGHVIITNINRQSLGVYSAPVTIGMIVRLDVGKLWWTYDGATFNNDTIANQNPINNTGGFQPSNFSSNVFGENAVGGGGFAWDTVFPAFSTRFSTANACTARFGATPFTYTALFAAIVGIGGTAWDGSGGASRVFFRGFP
jgi:hypothetical protein